MIKKIKYLAPLCILLSAATHATTCPPVSLIKAVTFTSALVYEQGTDTWELLSAPFTHDGITWNLAYGLNIPGAATMQEAIRLGQQKFKDAPIIIKHPSIDPIPGHLFCDYTTNGMTYWIQALSPPGQ